MFSGRRLLVLGLGLSLCLTTLSATAAGVLRPAVDFPLPVDGYHDQQIPRFSENSRVGFSGNRSTLLRPSFFLERSFTRFWPIGLARLRITISRATTRSSICSKQKTAHRISG